MAFMERVSRKRASDKGYDPDQTVHLNGETKLRWEFMAGFIRKEIDVMRAESPEIDAAFAIVLADNARPQ